MLKRLLIPMMAGLAVLPMQAGAWVHYGGGGFVHGPAGGTAVWHRGGWAGGGWGYHGDTVYHGGCWGCAPAGAAAAAGVVGLAAGAAIGAAAASTPSATVVVDQPTVITTGPAIGTTVLSLPGGCTGATVNGAQYYQCNGAYYKPVFGSSGVDYTVVANPF